MPLAAGTTLGRYEIRSLLGEGGMGAVYRAADSSLGRDVALKVLDPAVAVDPERVHRFLQEARAASALNHPNIIAIHEAGESGGTRFIATELVEGRTLRELLQDGPLPLTQALDIAVQVASALAAAHAAGIVHRDIKPENVMLRPDGYAKVLDFGLAKLTDAGASGAHPSPDSAATMLQTTAGVIMGTVAYMSPEQARALKVDARTDCYSLGAVIFEMITGRQPFTGATWTDVMVAILERDAPLDLLIKEGLPPQLVWVIAKALDKNPDLRHQSAADLRVDLERLRRDVATGAVYADSEFSGERPSAILRDVADSDPDAIAMYGFSRMTMAAAALGLVALIALPFLYRATAGAEQKAGLAEAAAEIRARDIAEALGRPLDGRAVTASLDESPLNLRAVRNLAPEEARRAIREGQAAQWTLNFNGTASDQQPGRATVTLTPDGKLRGFTSVPRTGRAAVTSTPEAATVRAAAAARQYLGVDVSAPGYKLEHASRVPDGTSFEIEWKNAAKVLGHDETIRANLDDTSFSTLERGLAYRAPETSDFWKRLNDMRGAFLIALVAGVYVFGVVVLARSKRWSLVGRRVPIAMSACIAVGFLSLAGNENGNIASIVAVFAFGLLVAFGALPAFAGLYGWLKQGGAVRMHGAEQLAAGHLRSPAVAASLTAGLAAGAVIAAISLAEWAASLRFEGYDPSVSRELTAASPGFYTSPAGWITAGLGVALAIAVMYELPHRLFKHAKPAVLVLTLATGVLTSSGQPVFLSIASTTLAAGVLMVVYGMRGLAATFFAVLFTPLLVSLIAARSVGGPVAGPRGTALTFVLLALVAFAVWSYVSASRPPAHIRGSSSRYS